MEETSRDTFKQKLYPFRYKALFLLTVSVYIILYAPYGFTDADDGFITALSWRIFNGQVPYVDFIYVRPPLTLYLHTLPFFILPNELVLISERVLFFISLALSSYFGAAAAKKVIHDRLEKLDLFFLSTIAFVYSVNSFTPMAWHTVDGVLLGSIGIYLLVDREGGLAGAIAGMFFLFLSTLTKQSFYLVPFAGLVYIYLSKRDIKETMFSVVALLSFAGIFIAVLALAGMLDQFILQTTTSTTFRDGYTAGVYEYLHFPLIYFLVPAGYWLLVRNLSDTSMRERSIALVPYLFLLFAFVYPLAFYLNRLYFKGLTGINFYLLEFRDPVALVLLILGLIHVLLEWKNVKMASGIALMLFLSWSSSISWAHVSPHLFAAPLVAVLLSMGTRFFDRRKTVYFASFVYLAGVLVYFIAYQKPFNSDVVSNIDHDLGKVNRHLSFIKGDDRIYGRLSEMEGIAKKYGKEITFLPAMPLADLFYGLPFNSPVDWPINCETAGLEKYVIDQISQNCRFVVIDAEWIGLEKKLNDENRKYSSRSTLRISKEWHLVENTGNFQVYKNPAK
ncbi:MAG: hypothetical protein HBSAPP04_17300 [Ignavibacteriaceae bacterium]|nr:MAG: hypothetical protein HBSAPP04_17300 [Ignavibacteriaceae bacterium]